MNHFVEGGRSNSNSPESLGVFQKIKILFVGVHVPRPIDSATPADVKFPFVTFNVGGQNHSNCEAWFVLNSKIPRASASPFMPMPQEANLHYSDRQKHFMIWLMMRCLSTFAAVADRAETIPRTAIARLRMLPPRSISASHQWPEESEILYGQSMGGAAIRRAIADLNVHPSGAIIESSYDRMLSIAENRFHAMGQPAFPLARLIVVWGGRQFGYSAFKQNPADYATHVHCAVLMMQGSLDRRVTNAQARNLFDHLTGARQFELFDNAGHCGFLQVDPNRWNRVVAQFLSNVRDQKTGTELDR